MSTRTAVTCKLADLNALVAEHLFGWTWQQETPVGAICYDGAPRGWWVKDGEWRCASCMGFSDGYSGSWEGMRLVVEKMRAEGWHCRLNTPFTPDSLYHVGFTPHGVTGWNGRPDFAASHARPESNRTQGGMERPRTRQTGAHDSGSAKLDSWPCVGT